ncbi:MAG TPA: energy transducer TonB [Candidatus Sulfotelmatobacter sp.]|nr:energy transducer TonB [Candidatus Sulfotelmatobacter sp.]
MSETLQVEEAVEVVEVHDAPKLLVEWSSPWREFLGAIGPALARSERRLAGEAPFGLVPLRIMLPSYFLEAFLILAAIAVQAKVAELRPFVAPRFSSHDVIYYSGDELPRTEDLGGAEAGTTGRAGGDEAHHHTQTIKIARGGSLVPKVVDAPNLKLPSTPDAVANLLAIKPDAGPPPVEGLRSTRTAPNLATTLVAPAPDVIRDYTRNGIQLDSVIAPAPTVARDRPLTAPNLTATLIAPAPTISGSRTLVAPALAPSVIPPAPSVARDRSSIAPTLNTQVVAPAPSVLRDQVRDQARDQARSTPALAGNVIPPAPGGLSREISNPPVRMTNPAVIPPPVSAPERATTRNSKLNLPAPSVIAPPPSADVTQDMRRPSSGSVPDSSKAVVPPPPSQPVGGSFMSSLMGKLFGPTEVVPPPPSVPASRPRDEAGTSLATNVVAPPPAVSASAVPRGTRNGAGTSLGPNVVAPPPSTAASGNIGNRTLAAPAPAPAVVPPPPSLSGGGGGTGNIAGGHGVPSGTLLANNIVPPPPAVGGGSASSGLGLGRKGTGLGAPLDAGASLAPPSSGGSGANSGAVISSQPGPKVGLPSSGGNGSLAISPSGGDKPGLGGAGGGASIGRGNAPGSGLNGAGPGAGRADAGHGSDPNSGGGISPAAGPGGAGNAPAGAPAVRGVDISGGSTIVNLPSFGSDPSGGEVAAAGHTAIKHSQTLGVTVVATATSGGAFEPYKNLLHGQTYTTYIDTSLGAVVMQFSEAVPSNQPGGLTAPQSIRSELPDGLPRARMVLTCTLDTAGNLKGFRVREPGPAEMTAKVLAALRSWKFQPAKRGDQPVEVTAILGFGIDTNDRF